MILNTRYVACVVFLLIAHPQSGDLYVYQQYIQMPEVEITLKDGKHNKKWLIGSFVADNRACGFACRVGNDITEWDSHWLAVGGAKENESKGVAHIK